MVDDDRAVHLRELVEELRPKRRVEPDAARVEERKLLRVSDHDQRSLPRADHIVDRLAERGARRHLLDRLEQAWIAARVVLRRRAGEPELPRGPVGLSLLALLRRIVRHRVLRESPDGSSRRALPEVCHASGGALPAPPLGARVPSGATNGGGGRAFCTRRGAGRPASAGRSRPARPILPKAAIPGVSPALSARRRRWRARRRDRPPARRCAPPPATFTKTSAWLRPMPACRASTATIIASRFGSTPVATRRGIG